MQAGELVVDVREHAVDVLQRQPCIAQGAAGGLRLQVQRGHPGHFPQVGFGGADDGDRFR